MKKHLLFIVVFCYAARLYAQNTEQNKNAIVYVLPADVSELLSRNLGQEKGICFYLSRVNDNYRISLHRIRDIDARYRNFKNNSRELFLNKKFYPIFFDLDSDFSTAGKSKKDLIRFTKGERVDTPPILAEQKSLFVEFNTEGKVIRYQVAPIP
jgi:hypothetical protein